MTPRFLTYLTKQTEVPVMRTEEKQTWEEKFEYEFEHAELEYSTPIKS